MPSVVFKPASTRKRVPSFPPLLIANSAVNSSRYSKYMHALKQFESAKQSIWNDHLKELIVKIGAWIKHEEPPSLMPCMAVIEHSDECVLKQVIRYFVDEHKVNAAAVIETTDLEEAIGALLVGLLTGTNKQQVSRILQCL